jgi:hypothetical protein
MPSPIWTPAALSSERRSYEGSVWRLVEAQHRVSTLKLVDDLAEQELLEQIIEETKPALPPECRQLDYLLAAPFRYGAVYPRGSRFRRAGRTPGVFYCSEAQETALAEMAFYRLLFFAESPDTPWPRDAGEYTAFSAAVRSSEAIDLTRPPFDSEREIWSHATDYLPCQDLADKAREAALDLIRYESVRDPGHRANVALLNCRGFARRRPIGRRTWRMKLGPSGVQAICEFPELRLGFDRSAFSADPRIARLRWER